MQRRDFLRLTAAASTAAALGTKTPVTRAPVTRWAARHAIPLSTVDAAAPLDDLAPLRHSIGDAVIVGLGESVHGAAEELTLKHRLLRLLVERIGARSVAWEEDWAIGRQIDRYIRGGAGDVDGLVGRMSGQWQTREVADVLRWLRSFNSGRHDQVQFVGVEQPFGAVGPDQFAVDLRAPAPEPVRRWLTGPITTRGLPGGGPDAHMSGGSLAQWFDVIVHRQVVHPAAGSPWPATAARRGPAPRTSIRTTIHPPSEYPPRS